VCTLKLIYPTFFHRQVCSNGILFCRICGNFPVYFPNNLTSVISRVLFLGGNKDSAVYFIVLNVLKLRFPVFYFFITAHIKVICVTNFVYRHTAFPSLAWPTSTFPCLMCTSASRCYKLLYQDDKKSPGKLP
jgi:hypothetical protein